MALNPQNMGTNMGLFFGSLTSTQMVDVMSSSRSWRLLYIMSSFIRSMLQDLLVRVAILVCSII